MIWMCSFTYFLGIFLRSFSFPFFSSSFCKYYFTMHDAGNDLSMLFRPDLTLEELNEATTYSIWTDDILISSSSAVFDGDTVSFTLPYLEDKEDGNDSDFDACTNDMVVYVATDDHEEKINWTLVDSNTGEVVIKGGPFGVPFGAWFKQRACLPDGDFVFTINVQDSLMLPSFYALYVEGVPFVLSGEGTNFGNSASHSFTLPLVQMPSLAPTKSLSPSSSTVPTRAPSQSFSPSETCSWLIVQVEFDWLLWPISWEIRRILASGDAAVVGEGKDGGAQGAYADSVCLIDGQYEFTISSDWTGRGAVFPGRYSLALLLTGDLIVHGESIREEQRTPFQLPFGA
mmetsp:Transcript_55193/g.117327  ORF Transcript_55193/g.117327 Transcript_55193/m.117327 type:complete len:343 (+) Transcript_55193:1446-2474(+)